MNQQVLVVLDLDRTLFDTDAYVQMLMASLKQLGVSDGEINDDLEYIFGQVGASFSLLAYLEGEYGAALVNQACESLRMSAKTAAHLLPFKGSRELLEELARTGMPHMILTFGEEASQRLKLDLFAIATGIASIPTLITDQPDKAQWMNDNWFNETQSSFIIPASVYGSKLTVEGIILFDDKASNLQTNNPHIFSVLVDNTDKPAEGSIHIEHALHQVKRAVAKQFTEDELGY